jgi:hemoglobin-like flavoprotein
MDMKNIAKQTIGFNKAAFNNGFAVMMLAQEQFGIVAENIMSQISGVPAEGREAIGDWTRAYKQGCDLFIKAVNDVFEKTEDFIDMN